MSVKSHVMNVFWHNKYNMIYKIDVRIEIALFESGVCIHTPPQVYIIQIGLIYFCGALREN